MIAAIAAEGVTPDELERAKTRMVADVVYDQDNQSTLARWYGSALTTGMTVESVQTWPARIRAVTADQRARRRPPGARQAPLGDRVPDQGHDADRGEAIMRTCFARLAVACTLILSLTSLAHATKIERVISPGGIEAWLVQDKTVPLIAVDFAFRGGAIQDPADKAGLANMVAALLDEGAGELDAKTFHERLEAKAIQLGFSTSRDNFRGSLRTLTEHRVEAFELLRLSLTAPRFEAAEVERIRGQVIARLTRETTSPNEIAGKRWWSTAFPRTPTAAR